MKGASQTASGIPDNVIDVLKNNRIGYLSVYSKKGELYSYPVAFHYSGLKIWFMTPVSAAKFKIIKTNPTVSFIVDNGKVTTEACGAMVQGKAKILSIGRTLVSILSVGPKIAGFTKKYPGMLTFYARGKGLPDERKLYKYRLIRIDPSKIVYWLGYNFGRYSPKSSSSDQTDFPELSQDEPGLDVAAKLLQPEDRVIPAGSIPTDHDWLAMLDTTVSEGILSEDERRIIESYRSGVGSRELTVKRTAGVTEEERKLLRKSIQS